ACPGRAHPCRPRRGPRRAAPRHPGLPAWHDRRGRARQGRAPHRTLGASMTERAEQPMPDEAPHLLVGDDDRRIRDLLQRYLTQNGYRVTVAGNAEEARRHLAGLTFDLLVLDVMMPGEDGLSFTRDLRRDSTVPILILTARGEPETRIHGLEIGADD